MLVHYSYLDYKNQEHGPFEVDMADFKAFLREYLLENVKCMVVELDDGRVYIWQLSMLRIKREGYYNGWALAGHRPPNFGQDALHDSYRTDDDSDSDSDSDALAE